MIWSQLESNWKEFAGAARAHWSKLTEDDWQAITGKREQLVDRIQQRYGIAKDAAQKEVDEWSRALLDIAEGPKARS